MVKRIQKLIGTEVDGIFGNNTLKVIASKLGCDSTVESVQKRVSTAIDGIIGPNTLNSIYNALQSTTKPKEGKIRIALMPGHSSSDGGAVMVSGLKLSEYKLANLYIPEVKEKLEKKGYEVVITSREDAGGTTPIYSANAANRTNADIAIEFHFNSASSKATGSEFLYDVNRPQFKNAAKAMCFTWSKLTGLKDRGVMPVGTISEVQQQGESDKYTTRGINAFKKANMFFCMTEPFFSSNPDECEFVTQLIDSGKWSDYMADTIEAACKVLFNK